MTPFGRKVIELREEREISHEELAALLEVSPIFLSSLQDGYQGAPSPVLIYQIEKNLQLKAKEADDLRESARLSRRRVALDTSGCSASATELANVLSDRIRTLQEGQLDILLDVLYRMIGENKKAESKKDES
ncbi:MAG: transcriptional regulator [Dongiaceae bacterium]